MKTFITYILFLLVSLTQIIIPQDSTQNSLKQSMFALQFQITGDFNLRPFQGSVLSFKYHIFDESALRFGFSLSNSNETFREENGVQKDNSEYYSFEVNTQFIQYIKSVEDVSLFIGTGPYYSRSFSKIASNSSRRNTWSIGLSGIIGVEWFFKNNMSLSAEYGLLFYYSERLETNYTGDNTYKIKSYNTSDYNMLKLGISIYI